MRSPLRLVSAAILSLLCAISVFAQASQTGGITGVVTDSGGALVSGATVDVISESTGKSERTATTAGDGGYAITLLKPGAYRLEITAPNFKKAVVAAVQVQNRREYETRRYSRSRSNRRNSQRRGLDLTDQSFERSNRPTTGLGDPSHVASRFPQFPVSDVALRRYCQRTNRRSQRRPRHGRHER